MNFDELIQKEEKALLRDLRELVHIPSVSVPGTGRAPYGAECRRALDWFLSRASEMGFQTRDVDGHCGWCEYGEGEEMVAVLCHLDVVPAGDGWHYPPYDCTWAGGRIYGRGVIDDKGPAAAALYALKAVRDSGAPLHRRVRLLVGCNEEKGSSCIRHYVEAGGEIPVMGFTPDGMYPIINGEKGIAVVDFRRALAPSPRSIRCISGGTAHNVVPDRARAELNWPEEERSAACALTLDGVRVTETAEGLLVEAEGQSAHGSTPEKGVNAIGRLLLALKELGLDGDSGQAAAFLADVLGEETRGEGLGIAMSDQISGALTVNLGIIRGGGEELSLTLDLRWPVTARYEDFADRLMGAMERGGFAGERTEGQDSIYMPPESPLVQALSKVYREQTGQEAELLSIGGGTYAKACPNLVAFGPLFPGQEMTEHQPDEYMEADTLLKNAQMMAAAIWELAR